jgi:hypothetical protein
VAATHVTATHADAPSNFALSLRGPRPLRHVARPRLDEASSTSVVLLCSPDSPRGATGIGGSGGGGSAPAAVSASQAVSDRASALRIAGNTSSMPKAIVLDHLVPPG